MTNIYGVPSTNKRPESMTNSSGGGFAVLCVFIVIGAIIWGVVHNSNEPSKEKGAKETQSEMEERQEPEARTYVDGVIEAFKSEGHTIDKETIVGRCAYDNVVDELKGIEKAQWTEEGTKSKLLSEYSTCRAEEESANESSRKVTAHLACRHYAENYFFPYEVKFHNIAGVIYDAARGDDEWVYTLDITVKSAQGGEVRYNMDCVTSNFSYDNSSATVTMFEALPY